MRRLRLFALAAVLALAAAACGDDTTPGSQATTPAGTTNATPLTNHGTSDASSMTDFTIELDDNYFQPTFIKMKDGQKLSIELENEGATPHNFTISALNINQDVNPGGKEEIEVTFSGTSDIAFFCRFHAASGMRGALFSGSVPQAGGGGGTSGTPDRY